MTDLTPTADPQAAADKAIDDARNNGCCCDHLAVTHVIDASGAWHVILEHDNECDGLHRS